MSITEKNLFVYVISFVIFLSLSSPASSDRKYYDKSGNLISEKEYKEMVEKWREQRAKNIKKHDSLKSQKASKHSSYDSHSIIIPKPGKWTGDDLCFNVSEDGTFLTSRSGACIEKGKSKTLSHFFNLSEKKIKITFSLSKDIPVIKNSFTSSNGKMYTVTGTFTSPTTAKGTFKIDYKGKKTGTWEARHIGKKSAQKRLLPKYDKYGRPLYDSKGRRITYLYDVIWKKCRTCKREVPVDLKAGEPCPHCKTPWFWPDETEIGEDGIKD